MPCKEACWAAFSHRRRPFWTIASAAVLAAMVAVAGCSYPPVSSGAYEVAVALDQALERRSDDQLQAARAIIDGRRETGEITDSEHGFLADIIATAESGQWQGAREELRRLLEDQVQW